MDTQSLFLQLPAELRNKIYYEIALNMKVLHVNKSGFAPLRMEVVCHQIRSEFLAVLEKVHPGFSTGSAVPRTVTTVVFHLKGCDDGTLSKRLCELSANAQEQGHKWDLIFLRPHES